MGKRFDLLYFNTASDLASFAVDQWLALIRAPRPSPLFAVMLSGGRISRNLFACATKHPQSRTVFDPVHFFWADERCVAPDDPESNYRLAHDLLFEPLGINPDRVHRIPGEADPETGAVHAAGEACRLLPGTASGQPIFDLVFLGMGEDGHVASLFPGEPDEACRDPRVYRSVRNSPKPPPERVTVGYPTLAAAREVWVLVAGSKKEEALASSLENSGSTPLGRVIKLRDHSRIFIVNGKRNAPI